MLGLLLLLLTLAAALTGMPDGVSDPDAGEAVRLPEVVTDEVG